MLTSGTCIVAIRTPNKVVIGVDSFENVVDEVPTIVCKIGIVGDIAFATAGLSRVFDDKTFDEHFNVRDIVRSGINPRISVEKNLAQIITTLEQEANTYSATASQTDKHDFRNGLMSRAIVLVLSRYENGMLKLEGRRLVLKPAPILIGGPDIDEIRFAVQVLRPLRLPDLSEPEIYVAGSYDAIIQDFEYRCLMESTDFVGTVKDAISIQAGKDGSVGGPIRIIEVTESGIRWRRAREGCV